MTVSRDPYLDLLACAEGLGEAGPGLWRARDAPLLSYPDAGNAFCYEVEDSSFWFGHRNRCLVEAIKRLPPPGVLVDVGGGNGFVSRALRQAGIFSLVVEPGTDGAANSLRRGLEPVVQSTFEAARFAPASVAAIGLFDVIEHLEDDRSFLKDCTLRLRDGGRVYVSVPAMSWLWSGEDVFAGHFRRYSRRALMETLCSAGLEIELVTYFFAALVPPLFLLRSLPDRLGARRQSGFDGLRREHRSDRGGLARMLSLGLSFEAGWIGRGRSLAFGTSCLAVARKRPSG